MDEKKPDAKMRKTTTLQAFAFVFTTWWAKIPQSSAAGFQVIPYITDCSSIRIRQTSAFQQQHHHQVGRGVASFHHHHHHHHRSYRYIQATPAICLAKPKRGSIVDSYQTVSVNCAKCGERLFRYKKKNGTKSNLIKCFVERIVSDGTLALLVDMKKNNSNKANDIPFIPIDEDAQQYACPNCLSVFARPAMIRGLPALKLVGGKVRMSKK